MRKRSSGFTILELLVVIAFVGILGTAAVYSLNLTRARSRDAKRMSDVSVLRTALSQHWLQQAAYPQSDPIDLGKPGARAERLTKNGFASGEDSAQPIYLDRVPVGPKSKEYYRYRGSARGYSLRFLTERQTIYGKPGTWYAHASGVDQEDAEK